MTEGTTESGGLRLADGSVVRAVILDVYHTLLKVDRGPEDAEERWAALCGKVVSPVGAAPSLEIFGAACREEIQRDHAVKKAAGMHWPEVDWREITRQAWPALADLDEAALDDFLTAHAELERRCSTMPGAVEFLVKVRDSGTVLGIASNAQRYTLRELRAAGLATESWFVDSLCFWSWREGFSKPDPGVFQVLTRRLADRGIAPEETLMIGDRADNDVLPARAAGWRTWHFTGEWPVQ
jgi:FMN phosphatase YigB (HAD superfamily)